MERHGAIGMSNLAPLLHAPDDPYERECFDEDLERWAWRELDLRRRPREGTLSFAMRVEHTKYMRSVH